MLSRNLWRLTLVSALAALAVPWAGGTASAQVGANVEIDSPDRLELGDEQAISFTLSTAEALPEDTFVSLNARIPPQLGVIRVEADGFDCHFSQAQSTFPTDVDCFPPRELFPGPVVVDVIVGVEPGNQSFGEIQALFDVGDERAEASKFVEIASTEPGFEMTIATPDRVTFREQFTATLTATTAEPSDDAVVRWSVDAPDRIIVNAASAPGFECEIRQFEQLPDDQFIPAGADCTASALAASVTLTLTLTVGPGPATADNISSFLEVDNTQVFASGDTLVILGSLPTTTVSGRVWNDVNRNGRQERGEPGVPGVHAFGPFVETETGPDGRYTLSGVEEGDEVEIAFDVTKKFEYTKDNVGSDTGDSDVTSNIKECEDCNIGFAPVAVNGPTTVDAGVFDPDVPVPPAPPAPPGGANPPPQGSGDSLARTGVPASVLLGGAAVLLALGAGLTLMGRRRAA